MIGYAIGGLFLASFTVSLAGAVTHTRAVYVGGFAVCAMIGGAVIVGLALAARRA